MFIPRLLLLALLVTAAPAAALTSLETTATVISVTAYRDRALTQRTATVRLKPGTNLIAITELPVLLQDDSVRVDGTGPAGATITGIEVRRRHLEQTAEKRVRELENEIRDLERELGKLDARKAGVAAQKNFVEALRTAWSDRLSKELAVRRPTTAELNEVMGFVGSNVTRLDEQGRDIETAKKQLKDRIDALKRRKNEATGSQRKESKVVEVVVESRREGPFTLELSAVVGQTGWEPAYDVRLAADGTSAELIYRAQVRQQTGEDWQNVKLTLSTARPASGGAPPELSPWRLFFPRPLPALASPPSSPRPAPFVAQKAVRMAEAEDHAESAAEEAPAGFQTADIDTGATSVSFRIPKPVSITADGSRHGTVISVDRLPVATDYVAVPKLAQGAWLTAELTNTAPYPLLPGEIRIFTGATFTGSAVMKKVAAGEKFVLPFGTDDQIIVRREEQKQHREAGMFGGSRMTYRYRVIVENLRKERRTVTVRDQLPLAENSEIKVSLEETGLKPDERKDDGTIAWKLTLAPGEKREFTFGIVVEYPKDRVVVGL